MVFFFFFLREKHFFFGCWGKWFLKRKHFFFEKKHWFWGVGGKWWWWGRVCGVVCWKTNVFFFFFQKIFLCLEGLCVEKAV